MHIIVFCYLNIDILILSITSFFISKQHEKAGNCIFFCTFCNFTHFFCCITTWTTRDKRGKKIFTLFLFNISTKNIRTFLLFLNVRFAIPTGVLVPENFVAMIVAAIKDKIVVLSMDTKDAQTWTVLITKMNYQVNKELRNTKRFSKLCLFHDFFSID